MKTSYISNFFPIRFLSIAVNGMGNTGITRLWESDVASTVPAESSDTEESNFTRKDDDETSSTGSLDYRSAQGEFASDEAPSPALFTARIRATEAVGMQTEKVMENRSKENPAKDVLCAHYDDLLVDITHPYSLVTSLLQKKLLEHHIGSAMLAEYLTTREKMVILVDSLIHTVSKEPNHFYVLVKVLEEKRQHNAIAGLLLQSHGALMLAKEVPRFTYSTTILKHTEELKAWYCKLSHQHDRVYNLLKKTDDVINCTFNKRVIIQAHSLNALQQELVRADPIAYPGILDCDTHTECIIIEGEKCVGKTQLVSDLCEQWDKLPALRKYQLIILLETKDKHVQNLSSIEDLLTYHPTCNDMQQESIQEVCDAKGKNLLVIIDGFEQLPHTITKNHDSFLIKLVEGKILPKSTKLITATPSVAREIKSQYNLTRIHHIQLLGFRTEHIENYAANSWEGFQLLATHQKMKLQSLMYLPLDAFIVTKYCHKGDIPETLTQCYHKYCLDLIHDYLKAINTDTASTRLSPQSFSDLHPFVQKRLVLLGKIALVQMINKDAADLNLFARKDFVHFGLMDTVALNSTKKELQFLNHMLQAFLAAYYISQQEECEQDQLFFNHALNEMSSVWKFVAGLSGLTPTIMEVVKSSIYELDYLPFILSLLYEQQDENAIKTVFGNEMIITYSLSHPEDLHNLVYRCYSLGYCIAASNCSWNLNLSSCNLKIEDLKALVYGLKSLPTICGSINSLVLDGNAITRDKLSILSELPAPAILHQVRKLSLNSCQLSQESLDYLATNIVSLTPNLQVLDIGNNNIEGHSKMKKVLSCLEDLPGIQELNIEGTAFNFEDMVPLNELLSMTGSTLTLLSIGGEHMCLESTNLLTDTVLTQSSIETLQISDLDLTRSDDTLSLLETNTSLTRLILFECCLDLSHLATSLCMNTTLKELEIFFPLSSMECDIGSEATVALCDMLEVNRSLNELSLYSYKPLIERRVTSIIETLTYNRTLEVLQLPHHFAKCFTASELNVIDSRVYWRQWPCIE